MTQYKKTVAASKPQRPGPRTILELDRFSSDSLKAWKTLSADLDQLEQTLYFALEPERRRLMPEMLAALQAHQGRSFVVENWVRLVSYTYSRQPLSAAGSLLANGGRFNAGAGLGFPRTRGTSS